VFVYIKEKLTISLHSLMGMMKVVQEKEPHGFLNRLFLFTN
jgi:hypothetical protein